MFGFINTVLDVTRIPGMSVLDFARLAFNFFLIHLIIRRVAAFRFTFVGIIFEEF